jgi:hypothetical protein
MLKRSIDDGHISFEDLMHANRQPQCQAAAGPTVTASAKGAHVEAHNWLLAALSTPLSCNPVQDNNALLIRISTPALT